MRAEVYWVTGVWPGKLGLAPRPRGGDWLEDEIADWKRQDTGKVVSLLMEDEARDLDLEVESSDVQNAGMEFTSLPIPDRGVPPSRIQFDNTMSAIEADLNSGKNIVVHCRQGIGRTGLVAACLMVLNGWEPREAINKLSDVRGVGIPETEPQLRWIEEYSAILAASK